MKTQEMFQEIKPGCKPTSRRGFLTSIGGITVAITAASPVYASAIDPTSRAESENHTPSFKEYVTQQLNKLVELTDENGVLQSEVARLRRTLVEMQSQLDDCRQQSGSGANIQAIQQTLAEIKRALHIP